MKKANHSFSLSDLPIWLALGLLWLITRLPINFQLRIGQGIGRALYHSSTKMRHIAKVNLELCFPEYTPENRLHLLKRNFDAIGMGIIETAMAWWLSDKRLAKCHINVTGVEHVNAALKRGKGIILLGPHFTCLEMIGRLLGSRYSFAVMYRPHKKLSIARIQERFRQKYRITHIARHQMRLLLRTLNNNMSVWYAYDVDGGEKRSVFAPFFRIQTASLTAVSRVITLTDAAIVPISFYRRDDCWGYDIKLKPALSNFPSNDLVADATRLNAVLEDAIREKPEQYIWQYKRFKTRPRGEPRLY